MRRRSGGGYPLVGSARPRSRWRRRWSTTSWTHCLTGALLATEHLGCSCFWLDCEEPACQRTPRLRTSDLLSFCFQIAQATVLATVNI